MIAILLNPKKKYQVLFALQAAILFIYSLALSLSNTLIYQNFNSGFLWKHWIGYASWFVSVFILNKLVLKRQKTIELFIFPIATMLTGLGIMTIWRISSDFGFRQSIIFGFISLFLAWLLSDDENIRLFTKRFDLILVGGIVLSLVTILFGTNPSGFGPKLWLGCCGVYLQPSEPLKLIFLFFLSIYLPKLTGKKKAIWFFLLVLCLTFLVLITQRDLGTSSIFFILFSTLLYIQTKNIKTLLGTLLLLILSGITAYFFIDLVQQRILTWIDPWQDPTNSSYQVIQALITIANGGINGRGPGIGYPSLVPIAHSDFIFTSIVEELGLIGGFAVILLLAMLTFQGFLISIRSTDPTKKLLAAGIAIYISAQSIVIIGGNVKLLPLTGVTLPFLSYGGSSLFTSYLSVITLFLLNEESKENAILERKVETNVFLGILGGFFLCAFALGWWGIVRSENLLNRTDNPRRSISDYYVHRGSILDRNNDPLTITEGRPGSYFRHYLYPELTPILGYTHPIFGQSSIEASFDDILRGKKGYSDLVLWWDHMMYGRPPTGLNIRTTIDSTFQKDLSTAFYQKEGGALIINSSTGELLATVSSPYLDANKLEELASSETHGNAPLINRLSQGEYSLSLIYPFVDELSKSQAISLNEKTPVEYLSQIGFFAKPVLGFEQKNEIDDIKMNFAPLEAIKLMASISELGICPSLNFVSAVQSPAEQWVILPEPDTQQFCFSETTVSSFAKKHIHRSHLFWSVTNFDPIEQTSIYVAGTMPDWKGVPITMLVVEEKATKFAQQFDWDQFFEQLIIQE